MSNHRKLLRALRANWWISLAGLAISFACGVILLRSMPSDLYAEYAAVGALVSLMTLAFEAGSNSGFTRYLHDAGRMEARATFYRAMRRRRWWSAGLCVLTLCALGPWYVSGTQLHALRAQPWLFLIVAGIVSASLMRLLAHYGLLGMFETKPALLIQQGFLVLRAMVLALAGVMGAGLPVLLWVLLVTTVIEEVMVDRQLRRLIGEEDKALPDGFIRRAQRYGLLTILDKACAMLGGGTMLVLVLAPRQSAAALAMLALAVDVVGKINALIVLPMGNLVAPYLSATPDDPQLQAHATGRVLKLTSLLYSFCSGAALLILPEALVWVYGTRYAEASGLALLLFGPIAFENWVRGSCSPALLRNGAYKGLVGVNIIQASVTLAALALSWRWDMKGVIMAVGFSRAIVSSFNLWVIRRIVAPGAFHSALSGFFVAAASAGLAFWVRTLLQIEGPWGLLAAFGLYAVLFYTGFRTCVLRDSDLLRMAHRLIPPHWRGVARILPSQPIS
jgi:hypothetical protein